MRITEMTYFMEFGREYSGIYIVIAFGELCHAVGRLLRYFVMNKLL